MIKQIIIWIWEHLFQVVIAGILIANLKMVLQIFVIQPIQGTDEKTSMPELAQYILILLLIYMIYQEAQAPEELFTGEKFLAVAGAVAGIAGVQLWKKNEKSNNS